MLSEPALAERRRVEASCVSHMRREHRYYMYILTCSSRRVLHTGVSNSLERRTFQHKAHSVAGFTSKYNANRLVYFERFDDVRSAIDREKQLKGWRRAKKIALVESMNPGWKDLSAEWGQPIQSPSWAVRNVETQDPSARDRAARNDGGPQNPQRSLAQDDTGKES